MKKNLLRIATRKSPLAIWQAEFVKKLLLQKFPTLEVQLLGLTTEGDKRLGMPLAKVGGKGLFVKELEEAILSGRADIAVHSMKDVPVEFPPGLGLSAICERENPYDAFVSNHYADLNALPPGAIVGTSSLRRQCLVLALRPDVTVKMLRGNVNTRLKKLDDGEFDAIILAVAGLVRLGMEHRIRAQLIPPTFLPAVGQGAMGIECLTDDAEINAVVKAIEHYPTRQCVLAERAMNRALEGGCQVPIAGFATLQDKQLSISGMVGKPDGSLLLRKDMTGTIEQAEHVGAALGKALLVMGADKILREVYQDFGDSK